MRLLLLIIGLTLTLSGFAQSLGSYMDAANLDYIMRNSPGELRNMTGEAYGTIGTPNFFEEFKTGNIYLSNKTVMKNVLINYDCFNDRVLFNRGEIDYVLNKRLIDFLEFPVNMDNSIVFKQVFVEEKKTTLFMKVVYQKESILYKHYYKTFQEADYTGAYNQDRRYNEYIDNHAWYIEIEDGELTRIRPTKKVLLQIMKSHKGEMEKFLKKENPDLKTEEGLYLVMEYYDELLTRREK